jgi:hypothetical protein
LLTARVEHRFQKPKKASPIQLNAAIEQINAATEKTFRAILSWRIGQIQFA